MNTISFARSRMPESGKSGSEGDGFRKGPAYPTLITIQFGNSK